MSAAFTSPRIRSLARTIRAGVSALALLVAATAAGALFASQQLADFMSEGPGARLLGVEEMQRRQVIGSAVLVCTAVMAAGVLLARRSPLGWLLAFLASLVGAAFAPPLLTPAAALLALAAVATWVEAQPDARLALLAPRRHPLVWGAGGVAGVAGLVAVSALTFWLARPLIDPGAQLDEGLGFEIAAGAPAGPASGGANNSMPASMPMGTPAAGAGTGALVARGMLKGTDSFHHGSGTVSLVRSPEGQHLLRFEEYAVQNGPDLFVYLTPDANGEPEAPGAVNLGMVRATRGSLNYEVPSGTDVSAFKSAVIWCRQFDVIFAVAKFE